MPLTTEELEFAVDDARKNLSAEIDLMHANDRMALGFLQLDVALAVAALSGATVILSSSAATPVATASTALLPIPLGYGLGAFGLSMAVSALCCLAVLWPADWRLPGREPAFWQWADSEAISFDDKLRAYLAGVDKARAANGAITKRNSRFMLIAKCLCAAAPMLGLVAGIVAALAR